MSRIDLAEMKAPSAFRCDFCRAMTSSLFEHSCGTFFGRRMIFRPLPAAPAEEDRG